MIMFMCKCYNGHINYNFLMINEAFIDSDCRLIILFVCQVNPIGLTAANSLVLFDVLSLPRQLTLESNCSRSTADILYTLRKCTNVLYSIKSRNSSRF